MATNVIRPSAHQLSDKSYSAQTTDIEAYLRDESKLSTKECLGVFKPKDVAELQGILSELHNSKAKVTISAARTGLTGGGIPDADSYLISLERLTGLVSADSERKEITVRAGTSLMDLNRLAEETMPGYFFPVDPTEQSASVGGAAALNAGGARSLRFGSVRYWISGLKVLLVDGSELNIRRGEVVASNGTLKLAAPDGERTLQLDSIEKPLTKNTIGYFYDESVDLVDLFIGSEGSLGIIVEATVRLEKRPETFLTHLQIFKSMESALECVAYLRVFMKPYSLELIDRRSIEKLFERPKPTLEKFTSLLKDAEAALFIEIPFPDDDTLIEFSESFFEYLEKLNEDPDRAISGTDERTLSDIKKLRHAVPERMNEIIAERKAKYPGLHKIGMDMAVTDEKLRWVYDLYERELSKRGFEFVIFGHAGNNHFHTNILPRSIEELEKGKQTYLELSKMIVEAGGAVAAEHGIGRLKKRFLAVQYSERELEKFHQIKKFFDPELRLNSHVLV